MVAPSALDHRTSPRCARCRTATPADNPGRAALAHGGRLLPVNEERLRLQSSAVRSSATKAPVLPGCVQEILRIEMPAAKSAPPERDRSTIVEDRAIPVKFTLRDAPSISLDRAASDRPPSDTAAPDASVRSGREARHMESSSARHGGLCASDFNNRRPCSGTRIRGFRKRHLSRACVLLGVRLPCLPPAPPKPTARDARDRRRARAAAARVPDVSAIARAVALQMPAPEPSARVALRSRHRHRCRACSSTRNGCNCSGIRAERRGIGSAWHDHAARTQPDLGATPPRRTVCRTLAAGNVRVPELDGYRGLGMDEATVALASSAVLHDALAGRGLGSSAAARRVGGTIGLAATASRHGSGVLLLAFTAAGLGPGCRAPETAPLARRRRTPSAQHRVAARRCGISLRRRRAVCARRAARRRRRDARSSADILASSWLPCALPRPF